MAVLPASFRRSTPASLLRAGVGARLLIALGPIVLIWTAVLWAIA